MQPRGPTPTLPLSHSPTLPLRDCRLQEPDSEDFEKRVCSSKLAARLRGIHCRQQIFHIVCVLFLDG